MKVRFNCILAKLKKKKQFAISVVDKTGKPATSKICSFSPNANRARRMEQILLLAGFPVLSTTVYSLYIHFLYN